MSQSHNDLSTTTFIDAALDTVSDYADLSSQFEALIGTKPALDQLPPQLCAFCHNILVNAITVVCGHTFCPQCVETRSQCWCGVSIDQGPSRSRRNIVISNTIQQLFPSQAKFFLRIDELEKASATSGDMIRALVNERQFSTDAQYCNFLQGRHYLGSSGARDLPLAAAYFQVVLAHDPTLAYVWCYQAETLAKQGQYIKSLARLLLATWLDPAIPHAAKLSTHVFALAQRERHGLMTKPTNHVSVIAKRPTGPEGNYHKEQLDTENRVTFNPVTGITTLPDFSTQNTLPTTLVGCTMSDGTNGTGGGGVGGSKTLKRKRTFDQVDHITFSRDFRPSKMRALCDDGIDDVAEDVVDYMSIVSLGEHMRHETTLLKAEGDQTAKDDFHAGDLECPLCLRIYWEPDVTPCGHTFCGNCLERTLDHDPKCPLCKQSLVEFLEMRQPQKGGRRTDQKLTRIIQRYLPEEYAERKTAAQEEEAEMLERLPIFVCTLAFPGVPCPLHVFEPRHRLLLRRCMRNRGGEFGMNLPRTEPGDIPFERIGTRLLVKNANYFRDGRVVVESVGVGRFKVNEVTQVDGYDSATFVAIIDQPPRPAELARLGDLLNQVHNKANEWFQSLPPDMSAALVRHFGPMPQRNDDKSEFTHVDGPAWPWWVLAVIPAEDKIKMHVLAQTSLAKRLTLMSRVIACIITQSSSAPR